MHFPNLPPGKYVVTTELQGFKKAVREDVPLDAAASVTMDFALEAGALTESVTVTAESPVLQTDTWARNRSPNALDDRTGPMIHSAGCSQ